MLTTQIHSSFSTPFCVLIIEICILLSFSISASKLQQLLITTAGGVLSLRAADTIAENPNRIQREFDSNGAIASQEYFSYSESKPPKANHYKPFTLGGLDVYSS